VGALTHRVAKAIYYAVDRKVDVINLSLGWPKSIDTHYVRKAFQYAFDHGVSIVAAAGNNDSQYPIFPCAYKAVICVGSHSIDNKISAFSNYGGHVDVAAAGDNILSTYPGTMQQRFFPSNGYEIKNGTSFASPVISAYVAILKTIDNSLSQKDILGYLHLASEPLKKSHRYLLGEYLVRLAERERDPKRPDLVHVYLDSELKPYYAERSKWYLNYEWVALPENFNELRFVRSNHPQLGPVVMPIFKSNALIPKHDQNPDFFDFEKNEQG